MKTINEVQQLDLPISVKEQLIGHILEPWSGDLIQAEKFWKEVSTCLILIEQNDTDQDLLRMNGETTTLLSYAVNHPEFVLLLNDISQPYLLALTVHTDEGAGCYLLAPTSSDTNPVRTLSVLAE
ncbi:hypothetical protein [Vibrio cortegadensis]|uniref:hypothetical protein n=1 Tax=Vibrio cortegadensis TaxID=1328770 RepID=UPI00352D020A